MHWSEPARDGRTPAFCSACGSRTQSRKRLSGAAASLRHQVDLLAEIARRQDEDLGKLTYERDRLRAGADRRLAHGRTGVAHLAGEAQAEAKERMEAQIATERAEITRLRRELAVWREQGLGEGPELHGRPSVAEQDLRQEEVRHEAERQQWLTRRGLLRQMIDEVEARTKALERPPAAAHANLERAGMEATRAEASRLRVEVEEQRTAVTAAWGEAARLRQEAEEERRSEAGRIARHKKELDGIAEELQIAERRAEVEVDLRRSQEAQLQSVRGTVEALRTQLQKARSDNAELRANLEQNQEVLRRLRG